ncbi:V-type ATP synthase subunit A [Myxococcota bacterium]|nr:V-type ATP synthase subunit A [Myxococcota bacterium]
MTPSARVVAVHDDVVTIEVLRSQGEQPSGLMKNEVVYILPELGGEKEIRLKAEVLRVRGDRADAQVFEDTRGVAVGAWVEQTGRMLSAALGPGLLGQVYDGLQNPLEWLASEHGLFLPRGVEGDSLNEKKAWAFSSRVRAGDTVKAGDILGHVQESRFTHKVMVPFDWPGRSEVVWIQEGQFTVTQPVAALRDRFGREQTVTMAQRWPVRKTLASKLLQRGYSERLYPDEPLVTTTRLIDTLFPVARGGTACIPGPFGAGKTVLQHLLSRFSDVDIVLVVACGERAGEVVETITEFPSLRDPRGGGSLMDRTIILCNTSSMPVAARESSIYMGVTLGEYYRQMGLHVLMLADSTSRWAQAMRETSGRLEEIPGEEAFPAYLDSAIRGVYERAGVLRTNDGSIGSLTIIGTVSPAGGNFEEPVTQSTLRTVKTFLGLSAERAYKRSYPAIDPLLSWSRYLDQLEAWYTRELGPEWVPRVKQLLALIKQGEIVRQMMLVTGEEGISLHDAVAYHKALFLDRVYLQQDAFDAVDASVSLERQKRTLALIMRFIDKDYPFEEKQQIADFFTRLTGLFKNLNYAREGSSDEQEITAQILALA